jgi:pimeloyl-ACP methyl ester carboxylesterase
MIQKLFQTPGFLKGPLILSTLLVLFGFTLDVHAQTTYSISGSSSVSEGAGSITFTISRSGSRPAETVYVSTTTTEGSSNNSDYVGINSQAVSFSSNQSSRTVTVTITNNSTVESSETFGFIVQRNASDPVGTYLAKRTFTITDDDAAGSTTYSISGNSSVSEGAGSLTFTISRSGSLPAETIYASTTTTEGSSNNSDYVGVNSQAVAFTSNQTSRTVTVTITNNSTVESSETFGFIVQRNASDPVGTFLAKRTFTITDDDAAGSTTYTISGNSSVSEGAGSITFTITRSGSLPAETIYASTTTTEGSSNNSDYVGVNSQAVAFTSNQTSRTVAVTITDNSTVESSETFGFIVQRNASDPVGTFLAKRTFTITDDDTAGSTTYTISGNSSVSEGAGSLTFTITRSGSLPAETIYASTTTTEGSSNNSDYIGVNSQAVAFTSNQTSRTVTVTITDNSSVESSETFGFIVQRNSSDPVGTFLAKRTFTITDDDTAGSTTYTISGNSSVSEGAGSITFTITRSGSLPAETIYASTTTTEGSSNNSDYGGVNSQSIAFSSNQTSRAVTISITNDTAMESSETFGFIVQRNASDPVATFLAKRTFTITDDDVAAGPGTLSLTAETPYWDKREPAGPAVLLKWTPASGATSYEVYRNNSLIKSGITGLYFTNETGMTAGQSYTFRVVARNANGNRDSNNISVGPMPGAPSNAKPDLIVVPGSITFSPSSVRAGNSILITAQIRNIGDLEATESLARLRLSLDSTLTSSDLPLSPLDISVARIQPANTFNISTTVRIPNSTAAGNYFLGVFCDASSTTDQSDESNDAGLSTTRLSVEPIAGETPPLITVQPTPQALTLAAADTLALSVTAIGPGRTYQWFRDASPIDGQNSSALRIQNVGPSNQGDYWVRVSNSSGFVDSEKVRCFVTSSTSPPVTPSVISSFLGEFNPSYPTVLITHGWQPGKNYVQGQFPEWMTDLRIQIQNRKSGVNVLLYSWPEAFTPDGPLLSELLPQNANQAFSGVDSAGQALANHLNRLIDRSYDGKFHVIGHSFGTFVNHKALSLIGRRIDQVTLLDSPTKLASTHYYNSWDISQYFFIQNFDWSLGGRVGYLDNYYSDAVFPIGMGTALSGARPGDGGYRVPGTRHDTIHTVYYNNTVSALSPFSHGFKDSVIISDQFSWTPPKPIGNVAVLATAITSDVKVATGFVERTLSAAGGYIRNIFRLSTSASSPAMSFSDQEDFAPVAASTATFETSAMDFDITVPESSDSLSFECLIPVYASEDWILCTFNDQVVFKFLCENFYGDEFQRIEIPISMFRGQAGVLRFTVNSVGASETEVNLTNFKFLSYESSGGLASLTHPTNLRITRSKSSANSTNLTLSVRDNSTGPRLLSFQKRQSRRGGGWAGWRTAKTLQMDGAPRNASYSLSVSRRSNHQFRARASSGAAYLYSNSVTLRGAKR